MTGNTTGHKLGKSVVLDLDGHEVQLGAIYQHGPVVVAWLRHYG
jgi:hypothetical protein